MTTDVLALREALERLRDAAQAFRGRRAVDWSDPTEKPLTDALVAASATLAAVRAETLAGPGVVDVAAVQKAVGILRDYSHGEECAVYAEDDDLVDVYDDPTNEACDCGLRDLILTLTGALPDVGATALALAATPPTPALTAARRVHRFVPKAKRMGSLCVVCGRSFFDPAHDAALATPAPEVERPDPERLLDAIEAQAIGEVEA